MAKVSSDSVFIIGGLGHVGLTLAAVLNKYVPVICYDINDAAVEKFLNEKKANFFEPHLDDLLTLSTIEVTRDKHKIKDCRWVVVTIGTTIDEYGNPRLKNIFAIFNEWVPYLNNDMTIILRSTVYPGVTKKIKKLLENSGLKTNMVFCPERTAEAKVIQELHILPQIIASDTSRGISEACALFSKTGVKLKILKNSTAGELAKLYTNAYRYINFAISNQMFMHAHKLGCEFFDIYDAIVDDYPRMKSFPMPGFTAGYCLRKDTIQLASYDYEFDLGYAASIVNESMPLFLFRKIREKYGQLHSKTVGLLGMAFKPDTDDIRDSLAFRMKKILQNECKKVICTDLYFNRSDFVDIETLRAQSDIIIVTCPHTGYKDLKFNVPVIDCWNFFKMGSGI